MLELLVTLVIISVLLTMVVAISSKFKERAEKVKCISQMRALHTSFTAHVEDTGHWPQLPRRAEGEKLTEDKYFGFFIEALEPYGSSREMWLCPSDKDMAKIRILNDRARKQGKQVDDRYFGSYVPTQFSPGNHTPFRWNQPWLLERGAFHAQSSHMLMPDGSVKDTRNPFYGR